MAIERVLKDENSDTSKLVLDYIMNPEKAELVTGINCTPETAFEEMLMIKTAYNKTDKRQFIHFVQSFHPEEKVTPEQVHEIGVRLAKEFERFSGFQMVVSTHLDQDHLHNHFVMNTVNMEHGLKWQQSPAQMQMAKDFSDQLCREYSLSTIEHKGKDRESSGEYRARQIGRSWKHELRLAVDACMKNSVNRDDFVNNMRNLGYDTKWTDTRKDITFFTAEGKPCRLDNLDKEWTKEVLEETFKFNQELKNPEDMAGEIKKLELAVQVAKAGAETQKAEQQADEQNDTKDSMKSWEDKLRQAIDTCMENSIGRADFIVNMRTLGYEVNWTDTRKDITFITPEGRKRRNSTLDENLTKEAFIEAFNRNKEYKDREVMATEIRKMELRDKDSKAELHKEEAPIEEGNHELEPVEVGDSDIHVQDHLESSHDDNANQEYRVDWSARYKEARTYLYGKNEIKQDFSKAHQLFTEEALTGNVLAMHDLGRMHADGLGVEEIDLVQAQEWYTKAFTGFNAVESEASRPYIKTYAQYRIGKMYATGLGTLQDYFAAANWLEMAVEENHKYAQYTLAGLYYRGQGVDQDYGTAFVLYRQSAIQGNSYADYELAKMLRGGIGTEKDTSKADEHFRCAFAGFSAMEKDSRDDKLQYRLGQMLYTGTGTEKNIPRAIDYLEKSANTGNVNAQYLLAKIYLETENAPPDKIRKALTLLEKAAGGGNTQAQYALAKILIQGKHVEKDIARALTLLTSSAEQKNQFAQYALGKLYVEGKVVPKDVVAGLELLKASVEQGNQFAQYTLGKLHLEGEVVPKDVAAGLELIKASVEQGNQFAQYTLGKLYLEGEVVPKDVVAGVNLLKASAEQKNQFAQYRLGKLYIEGEDVPKNVQVGIQLLNESAEQGNQFAQFKLGIVYLSGKDVPRDKELARHYFTLSAEQGNELAQVFLKEMDSLNIPYLMHYLDLFTRGGHNPNTSRYPLSRLEGHALKEKILELKFSSNVKWDKGQGYER
ncbi:TPR repeat-containing protein [Desulfitobacterium dehalogenans ATCC 51507]|uniref:TPR repeat-containing protein n=1 Tax=Desulfitobacterium dehalogenans (strain ATCC 51507 / DSM 9161 / JW/IU-DC1) TaxID=756499 RepID=I4ABZ0_DESDJ|nr:TPR repeat-containing protein [Desulfitobacterium dehalogenans ATCC 51507]